MKLSQQPPHAILEAVTDNRRAQVLDLVTESYIHSAKAVPSLWVAERLGVSSATVRNDFAALEEQGFLQQPHTSAGRIPTVMSYTRYARKFIPPGRLPKPQRELLEARLRPTHGERLLQEIADVTAELSGYAVVVHLPSDHLQTLEIHLSTFGSRLLAVVVLENGLVRQLAFELSPPPSEEALLEAEGSLKRLTLPVGEVPEALRDVAKHRDDDIARTLLALADAWPSLNPPRLFSQGLKNLLAEPESADPDFVRSVVERVETPTHDPEGSATPDIVLEPTLALVTARLDLGKGRGGLMLLGPLRMRYPEVLRIAHGVTETIAKADLN